MTEPGIPNDDHTLELACELRERVRDLNYAASGPPGLTAPQTVYAVLGSLNEAAYGLDQLLEQMGEFLEQQLSAGRLASTSEDGPDLAVSRAQDEMRQAAEYAQELSNVLEGAQREIAVLFVPETGTPPSPLSPRIPLVGQSNPAAVASADLPADADGPPSPAHSLPPTRPTIPRRAPRRGP
ncbi:hypothetical protein [Actinomadura oligospora]|uniref:hypothetical protein n=1 Tax=Actinomadura oligospora TaxID=111804 RepID=UPI0004BC74A8|nr:hypothetical protein [Actinomadura oligospora]